MSSRPRQTGSGINLTPDGAVRICFPTTDGTRPSPTAGRSEVEYGLGGQPMRVLRLGPRYNASVVPMVNDRRGSVDSSLTRIVRHGPEGPQVFYVRNGGFEQQPSQTSRVIHVGPAGTSSNIGGGGGVPVGRHQVIRIGPQGVRVMSPVNEFQPTHPTRIQRGMSNEASTVSYSTAGNPSSEYQNSVSANADRIGFPSTSINTTASQPRVVSYAINARSGNPPSTLSSTLSGTRGRVDWQDAVDVKDSTGCGGFIPGVGAIYRSLRHREQPDPRQQLNQQIQYQLVQPGTGPPPTYSDCTGSVELRSGYSTPRCCDDEPKTLEVDGGGGQRRFRVQVGSGGSGQSNQHRHHYQQQQPHPAAGSRLYSHPASGVILASEPGGSVQSVQAVPVPTFTVQAVGQFGSNGRPITDFGELICESIRQFMVHKQQQRDRVAKPQCVTPPSSNTTVNNAVPWRVARDESNWPRSESPQSSRPTEMNDGSRVSSVYISGGPESTSPQQTATPEDRNLFDKYRFQFESIGNFGKSNSRDEGDSGSGSWSNRQQRRTPSSQPGPIAVFSFQDFDEMVAKIRELRDEEKIPATGGVQPSNNTSVQPDVVLSANSVSSRQQQRTSEQQVQIPTNNRIRNRGSLECEDEDSGYYTGNSNPLATLQRSEGPQRQGNVPLTRPVNTPASPVSTASSAAASDKSLTVQQISREHLRHKISTFNNNSRGFILSLDQHSDIYHGIIRVHMNLIRPVQMALQPPSTHNTATCSESTVRDPEQQGVTTFHLPKGTTKVIHISSETTTKEVIRTLLSKFRIQDNPRKFALYEKCDGAGTSDMRRIGDMELPLPLCLTWVEKGGASCVENYSYVLQENDTGEIMWEAFSLPELDNFLMILNKEEEEYLKQITQTYRLLKIHFQRRLKELKGDRIGPGAVLRKNASCVKPQ